MKALFYNFPKKKFILKEIPVPRLKPDEVLIKIKVSSPCGTDLHIIDGPLAEKVYNKKEIILGHSFSGILQKVGKKVKNFKKGDRVFASSFIWCGRCRNCKEGKENLCDNRFVLGMEIIGSHAEYISLSQRAIFHLPKNIDFEDGSLIADILALGIHAFKKANLKNADKILIFGTGPVGQVLGILFRIFKGKSIFVAEPIKYRQNLAKKLFNSKMVFEKDLKNLKNQIDVVFETSGDAKALDSGYKCLKRGGKMIMIGVQKKNFNLNALKWISRELSLFGIFTFASQDIKEGLKLVLEKKINLKKIITHKFPLKKGNIAYQILKKRKSGRILFLLN